MPCVRIGRTGLRAARIAFGGAAAGGHDYGPVDDGATIAAIHAALDAGMTLFDVADVYGFGHAEVVLGRALASAGARRHDAVVATKVGVRWDETGVTRRDLSPAWIEAAVDQSLVRLGIEQIGVYQIHWLDGVTAFEDSVAALLRCVESGKVAALGCCNLSLDDMRRAIDTGSFETIQLPYSLLEQQARDQLQTARDAGMTSMAYNVLARGLLTGKFENASTAFVGSDTRRTSRLFEGDMRARGDAIVGRLRELADARGASPAQIAVRWALEQNEIDIVLVGAKTAAQALENAAAIDVPLSADEIAWLGGAVGAPPARSTNAHEIQEPE